MDAFQHHRLSASGGLGGLDQMFPKTHTALFPIVSIASLAIACAGASRSGEGNSGNTEAALDTENGGMTATDEQPGFGDPAVEAVQAYVPTFGDAQDMTLESAKS